MNKDILNEVANSIDGCVAFKESDKVLMSRMSVVLTTEKYQLLQAENGAMFVHTYEDDMLYRSLNKLESDAVRFMSIINGQTLNLIIPNI